MVLFVPYFKTLYTILIFLKHYYRYNPQLRHNITGGQTGIFFFSMLMMKVIVKDQQYYDIIQSGISDLDVQRLRIESSKRMFGNTI